MATFLFFLQVVENLNLACVVQVFVCTAISPTTFYMMHCALRLKRSGTTIPRMELVEVGPSMDLVVRRHRRPSESLHKEAMKALGHAKKVILVEQLFFVHHISLSRWFNCKLVPLAIRNYIFCHYILTENFYVSIGIHNYHQHLYR